MSSNESLATIDELDDWSDGDIDENAVKVVHSLDGRRRVESKLEELRLKREVSEYDFDF